MGSKRVRDAALATITVTVIFFAYAYILLPAPSSRWNSPDETANMFFSRLFAEKGELAVLEPLNFIVGDAIHPRSVAVVNGYLVPGSFIGLPLIYGTVGRILGVRLIPYLTPLLAIAAVFAFAALVRGAFGRAAGLASGVLLAAHPAWWYYTARGMFPNIPFLAFLILGAYFLVRRPFAGSGATILSRVLDDVLGAVFLVFAVWTRASELVWIAPVAAAIAVAYRRDISPARLLPIAALGIFGALMLTNVNQSLYGSSFATGYNPPPDDHEIAFFAAIPPDAGAGSIALNPLFPFGVEPRRIARNVWNYGLRFFWWYTIPTELGVIIAIRDWKKGLLRREAKTIFLALGAISFWLALVYGSGAFTDTANPSALSLGQSYARYFLPAFALAVPFAGFAIVRVAMLLPRLKFAQAFGALVLIVIAGASAQVVYWSAGEGLLAVRQTLARYERVAAKVFELVPESGVIITDRNDKLFFPERRVVVPLRDPGTTKALPVLARRAPLFYYGITLAEDELNSLNEGVFGESGLKLALLEVFASEALYKVERK